MAIHIIGKNAKMTARVSEATHGPLSSQPSRGTAINSKPKLLTRAEHQGMGYGARARRNHGADGHAVERDGDGERARREEIEQRDAAQREAQREHGKRHAHHYQNKTRQRAELGAHDAARRKSGQNPVGEMSALALGGEHGRGQQNSARHPRQRVPARHVEEEPLARAAQRIGVEPLAQRHDGGVDVIAQPRHDKGEQTQLHQRERAAPTLAHFAPKQRMRFAPAAEFEARRAGKKWTWRKFGKLDNSFGDVVRAFLRLWAA